MQTKAQMRNHTHAYLQWLYVPKTTIISILFSIWSTLKWPTESMQTKAHIRNHTKCLLIMALCAENHYNLYFVEHMEHSPMTKKAHANQSLYSETAWKVVGDFARHPFFCVLSISVPRARARNLTTPFLGTVCMLLCSNDSVARARGPTEPILDDFE